MSNAFEFALDDASVRRAAVEGVPQNVIAAIYLLHERSVGEVAAKLTPGELEHVIRLVEFSCPSPPGTLDALKSKRAASQTPTAGSLLPNAKRAAAHPRPQHRRPLARPEARQGTAQRPKRPNAAPKPTGFRGPPAPNILTKSPSPRSSAGNTQVIRIERVSRTPHSPSAPMATTPLG